MHRSWFVAIAAAAGFAALSAAGPAAVAAPPAPGISVAGAVSAPSSYTLAQLEALPQTTFTVTRRMWWGSSTVTEQGVSLESLVEDSSPVLPTAKNAPLRVIVTVAGRFGELRTFALGELDQNFGAHPAYLALAADGLTLPVPDLVVPGDRNGARSVLDVSEITVAVESPTPTPPPAAGALTIEDGARTIVLSAAQLAALPEQTLTVQFFGPGGKQTHTETGPTLDEVLRAARIHEDLNTWVAAVGSDGYVATVTPAEAWFGGRPLLISLVEDGQSFVAQGEGPRLVTDGDVKGGRYDTGMDDLVVGDAGTHGWQAR
jgi:hypothetical protein